MGRERRERLRAAKVVPVRLDEPLQPIRVDPRYAEIFVIVISRGRVVGRVRLPALSEIPIDVLRAAIAAELGQTLCRDAVRELVDETTPPPVGAIGAEVSRSRPSVSVVVCTRDRPDQLAACLESLLALATAPDEIVVVDNCPTSDATRELCVRRGVRYVREDVPGTGRARNRGVAEAAGEIVAFTDDDCVVDAAWLDDVGRHFTDPLVMVATGAIEPLELETSAQYLYELHGSFTRVAERRLYDGISVDPVRAPYKAGATANALVRRRAFELVGPFPEHISGGRPTMAGEDSVFFYEVLAAGYRIVADPALLVWHRHRRDYDSLRRNLFGYSVGLFAHATRALVARREQTALQLFAWLWLRYLPRRLRQALLADEDRVPLGLTLAEIHGALVAPWRLLVSRLARRGNSPPTPAPARAPARPRVVRAELPRVSVVVPSYNRRERLRTLLDALARQEYARDRFDAFVVLDGSTDGSAELVRSLELPFPVAVVEQSNGGAAAARNNGARRAANPVVAFLDDDVVPHTDFVLEHALAHAGAPDDHVAIGYCPPVIESNGLWPIVLRAWWEDHYRRKAEAGHVWTFADFSVGNSSLPRSLFFAFGGLDERFKSRGREDWELGLRLLRAGIRFEYRPRAIGLHHLDTTLATRLRQMRQEARDDVLFAQRHPDVKGQLLLAAVAEWLAREEGSVARRVYEHPERAARVARLALPALDVLETLRFRGRWLTGAQALVAQSYVLGIADVFPRVDEFLAFYAPTWARPGRATQLRIGDGAARIAVDGAGPLELEVALDGRSVRRVPVGTGDGQWDWSGVRERIILEAGDALARVMICRELEGLPTARDAAVADLEPGALRAG